MLKMLNGSKIVNEYRRIMAGNVSKSKRAAMIKAIPNIKKVTDNFNYISDGRVNVAKISFALAAEINFINSVVKTINAVLTNHIKKAQKIADKIADDHLNTFMGLTLDDVSGCINGGNYKRAVKLLSGFVDGSGLRLSAAVENLAGSFSN